MKNKTLRIILDLVLIVVGIIFLVIGIKDAYNFYIENKIEDNVRFKKSYASVPKDNIYRYVTIEEADEILSNKTGLILLGRTDDPWMQVLVKPLNDIVKEHFETIYYLELDELSNNEKKKVDTSPIRTRLEDMELPYIFIVKDGNILGEIDKSDLIDDEFEGAPIEYFDDEHLIELKNKLSKIAELK